MIELSTANFLFTLLFILPPSLLPSRPPPSLLPFLNPANELHLEVEQVLGGHIELCIKNLPIPLQNVDQAKLKVKLTAVDETSPRAKSATYVELITPYGGLKVVNSNTVCYSLSENEIAWRLPSQYIKVQVALRIDDTTGPYVPSISNATVIGKQRHCAIKIVYLLENPSVGTEGREDVNSSSLEST